MAIVIDLSAGFVSDHHLFLLEARLHLSVRLDVVAGYGRSGLTLVARSSPAVAARPVSALGSTQLDGTAVAGASPAGRGLPVELAAMAVTPPAWPYPDVGCQLVLRHSALYGRALHLSVVP